MRLPQIGDEFEQRYRLSHVLGEGGFATVFRASDLSTQREVVLKVLTPRGGAYPEAVQKRFQREARVFATLQNPHTITMYDFGESSEGLLYMVFEFVHGRELGEVLLERGTFAADEVIHIASQLLSALAEAHAANILHRDIKPGNILLFPWSGDPHRVKLIDFGIAKDMNAKATKITQTGRVIGTLRYMAPEQVFGERVDPRTDIFALGLVAAEMLTGEPVVGGESKREMLEVQTSPSALLLPEHVGTPALRRVIERMLAREPDDRFASAQDVLVALRDARSHPEGHPTPSEELPPIDRRDSSGTLHADPSSTGPRATSSRAVDRRVWIGLAVLGVLALAGFAVTFTSMSQDRSQPPTTDVLQVLSATPTAPAEVERYEPGETTEDGGRTQSDAGQPASADVGPTEDLGEFLPTYAHLGDDGGLPVSAYFPTRETDGPMPIVLMFHRRFRSGLDLLEYSEIAVQAEKHGFIAVAPNSPEAMGWPASRIDIAYRALRLAAEQAEVDFSRVFLIGDESGTRFANDLSCLHPISGVVTTFDGDSRTCEPKTPTPRMRLWGFHDPQTPRQGGFGCNILMGEFPSAERIIKDWRAVYGCSTDSKPWGDFVGGTCKEYGCPRAPLVECTMDTGHRWPGAQGMLVESDICPTIDPEDPFPMAGAIWRFFEQEGRRLTKAEVASLKSAIGLNKR